MDPFTWGEALYEKVAAILLRCVVPWTRLISSASSANTAKCSFSMRYWHMMFALRPERLLRDCGVGAWDLCHTRTAS